MKEKIELEYDGDLLKKAVSNFWQKKTPASKSSLAYDAYSRSGGLKPNTIHFFSPRLFPPLPPFTLVCSSVGSADIRI